MTISQNVKVAFLVLADIILISIAYLFSLYVRFAPVMPNAYKEVYANNMLIIIMLYMIPFYFLKMYKSLWRVASIDEVIIGGIACFVGMILNLLSIFVLSVEIPISVNILAAILITFFVVGMRLALRAHKIMTIQYHSKKAHSKRDKILIVGAGSCGRMIKREIINNINSNYELIGFIDDDKNKVGTHISGIKVLGTRNDVKSICAKYNVELILIAIPSISANERKSLVEICQETNVKTKIMPSINELIGEEFNLGKARDVDLKDLLGRVEVKLDKKGIKDYVKDKVVLVTGGGGTIGSELCRQIACFSPKLLLILDIYENNAYDLQNELKRKFPKLKQHVIISSVRDRKRMEHIFKEYEPQLVYHAAAHKHVPLMEFNPGEAIKNNVVGTLNVAECADKYGVEKFVLISTDKAVNPTNVMGATKRMCEMVVQALSRKSKTEFVAVRFGNVLGSNGSVIPLFKKQIAEGGPITLTNKYITRYFMLIPEAAQLVLQAGGYAEGGEIFVLDMGKPVKIFDLANELIKLSGYKPGEDIKIEITGLRPGEKLYEELLMDEEGLKETKHEKIFIGKPGDFDIKEINLAIEHLINIIKYEDEELIKVALSQIVKTYKREVLSDDVYEKKAS
ncbi:polysaccharide biosynthesis protein [Clostridium tarantellae]|uniref:NAD-dependent epimerase/dehydratase family protein n=1 Tax=Clostridium tarantellae TaxID=39493 RepID=A0A6I1MPJ5_9CLOT|nr:nucleoside-diphosphate sugar epimerase/dehydratase [Clostridium tarantellae]MPQ44723.1 NAD-dependent epimerase/dehydratase family protein [Clostridium tarantellae]